MSDAENTGGEVRLNDGLGPENPFETAAKIIRYYLKHQNYPSAWDRMDMHERAVTVTCENLERLMLDEAKKLNKIGGA